MNKTGTAGQVDMDSFREEISNLGEEYLYAYDHMGNDTIDGTDNDDTIVGGTGNDKLNGGDGNDTYIFHPGDGRLENVYIMKAA